MDSPDFCAVMAEAGSEVRVSSLAFWPMRLLLAYIHWPKAITAARYDIGDAILKGLGRKAMGDYKAYYAQAADQP